MRYLIIETFRNGPLPIYERFRDKGRLAPDGLQYIESWVDEDLSRCYQIMETDDKALLSRWMSAWDDIVEFEVIPVLTSREAFDKVMGGR